MTTPFAPPPLSPERRWRSPGRHGLGPRCVSLAARGAILASLLTVSAFGAEAGGATLGRRAGLHWVDWVIIVVYLGAVLGLIHVMGNITNPEALGAGIAVAFVATLYGVGIANLFFLPMGGKIKMRAQEHAHHLELIMEGAVSIAAGENPLVTEQKLLAWVHDEHPAPDKGAEKKGAEAAA